MKVNRPGARIFIFVMSVSLTFFCACTNKNESNSAGHKDITSAVSGNEIDSTYWLRPARGVRTIFEDNQGNIWMADNGSGLFMYNGDTTINFTRMHGLDEDQTDGSSLERTFSVGEDREGNIWIGTV